MVTGPAARGGQVAPYRELPEREEDLPSGEIDRDSPRQRGDEYRGIGASSQGYMREKEQRNERPGT